MSHRDGQRCTAAPNWSQALPALPVDRPILLPLLRGSLGAGTCQQQGTQAVIFEGDHWESEGSSSLVSAAECRWIARAVIDLDPELLCSAGVCLATRSQPVAALLQASMLSLTQPGIPAVARIG